MSYKLERQWRCAFVEPKGRSNDPPLQEAVDTEKIENFGNVQVENAGISIGEQARAATAIEHRLTVADGFRLYAPAVGWSLLFSLGIIVDGFDPQIGAFESMDERIFAGFAH